MARVTVEDCFSNVKNRFELVLVAAKRAREITLGGSDPKVSWDNDKPTVVALREIATGDVTAEILEDKVVQHDAKTSITLDILERDTVASIMDASSKDEELFIVDEKSTTQDKLT